MKRDNILRAFMDARKTTLDLFYDFEDKTYKAAKTRRDVFLMLASYAGADGKGAYPSMKTLADNCCISEKQVQRIIAWLEANGLLLVKHKGSKDGTNLYTVLIPGKSVTDISEVVTDIPTVVTDISEVVTDISSRFGSRGFRENRESERERTKPAHASLEGAAGQVSKLISKAGGSILPRDLAVIQSLIAGNDWTDAEITKATELVLGKLDPFELKQAGKRLITGLPSEISIEREHTAEMTKQQELIRVATEKSKQDVERELQELDSEVIETML
jgi:hypothetical protein